MQKRIFEGIAVDDESTINTLDESFYMNSMPTIEDPDELESKLKAAQVTANDLRLKIEKIKDSTDLENKIMFEQSQVKDLN